MKRALIFTCVTLFGLGCGVRQDLGSDSSGSTGATASAGEGVGSTSTGEMAASSSTGGAVGSTGSGGGAGSSTSGSSGTTSSTTVTGAGGSSGTTSSATVTGSGGAAGSASSSATSSVASAGSGGGTSCAGYIDVTGLAVRFTSACPGHFGASATSTAIGYRVQGGALALSELMLDGCATYTSGSAGIDFSVDGGVSGPGTYTIGSTSYTDASGAQWTSVPGTLNVVITKFGGLDNTIEGTFSTTVSGTASRMLTLTGFFSVCDAGFQSVP